MIRIYDTPYLIELLKGWKPVKMQMKPCSWNATISNEINVG